MAYRGPRIRATKSPHQYPYQQYAYQNVGTQLTWRGAPPFQTRGADAASLGLGGTLERPTLELPRPGAPEPISIDSGYSGVGDCGCGCGGRGACRPKPMGAVEIATLAKPAALALGAYLIYKALKKKR